MDIILCWTIFTKSLYCTVFFRCQTKTSKCGKYHTESPTKRYRQKQDFKISSILMTCVVLCFNGQSGSVLNVWARRKSFRLSTTMFIFQHGKDGDFPGNHSNNSAWMKDFGKNRKSYLLWSLTNIILLSGRQYTSWKDVLNKHHTWLSYRDL